MLTERDEGKKYLKNGSEVKFAACTELTHDHKGRRQATVRVLVH